MKHLVYICALLIGLSACTTTRYVPVETTHTQIEYRDRLRTDSVFVSDSVYIREKGDTIFMEHTRYLYRDRLLTDTAYVHVTDSVQVPYPVPASLTRWQQFKQDLGGIAFGIALLAIILGIVWLIRKLRH